MLQVILAIAVVILALAGVIGWGTALLLLFVGIPILCLLVFGGFIKLQGGAKKQRADALESEDKPE